MARVYDPTEFDVKEEEQFDGKTRHKVYAYCGRVLARIDMATGRIEMYSAGSYNHNGKMRLNRILHENNYKFRIVSMHDVWFVELGLAQMRFYEGVALNHIKVLPNANDPA